MGNPGSEEVESGVV